MKIELTPSPNQLQIKHFFRNRNKQKFLSDIYIFPKKKLSDRNDYPKQFWIRNPIRHSLPKIPSDRIFYPKPFQIKNPIWRGFLKKTLSDRISYPKLFRIENPIRIARRMKSCDPGSVLGRSPSWALEAWTGEQPASRWIFKCKICPQIFSVDLLQAHGFTTLFVLFKWDLQAAMKDYPEDQALLSRLQKFFLAKIH